MNRDIGMPFITPKANVFEFIEYSILSMIRTNDHNIMDARTTHYDDTERQRNFPTFSSSRPERLPYRAIAGGVECVYVHVIYVYVSEAILQCSSE